MQSCRAKSGCNVWVYCALAGGCSDGYGKVYPHGVCALKYQAEVATGSSPQMYSAYGTSEFISGKVVANTAV